MYLFPAVVGGGLGDIEEVLAAGRQLARAGLRVILYRRPDRPFPRSVAGPWDWPPIERRSRIAARGAAALTISPAWGLSAAPTRSGPLGRGGVWEAESRDVERQYGAASTLHVSLEEFARTLTAASEDRERLREGGVPARGLSKRLAESRRAGELARLGTAFSRYRAFDRPNVLHLFATLRRDDDFARAFPSAVQTGPLWPKRYPRRIRGKARPEWVWYASPASAEVVAADVARGLAAGPRRIQLTIRTDRPWHRFSGAPHVTVLEQPVPAGAWRRRFAHADLRIVTGSRSLLEAIEVGGPFLYFNGVLGAGRQRRRHRPEKLQELLRALRALHAPGDLVRDLADFGGGRRVRSIVARAAARSGGWSRFPTRIGPTGFRPPYDDAGELIRSVAVALADRPREACGLVARVRAGAPL